METAIHFWASGRVQGVYFRASTQAKAQALGLTGWVKNLADGRVEGVVCGEQQAVDTLVQWLAIGPENAFVKQLNTTPETPEVGHQFEIR